MGETVVLLGAGPGLGRAIAQSFVARGHHVSLVARDQQRASELAESIRSEASAPPAAVDAVAADAGDADSLLAALQVIRERRGDPTVLVHNPSLSTVAPATSTSLEDLMAGIRLSVGSLLVAAGDLAPSMVRAGRGAIFVTGSQAALAGSTWSASLGVQKAAVRNLTFSLASELGPSGVHVTTVTIHGVLDSSPQFAPSRIAETYVRLLEEEPDVWQNELNYR